MQRYEPTPGYGQTPPLSPPSVADPLSDTVAPVSSAAQSALQSSTESGLVDISERAVIPEVESPWNSWGVGMVSTFLSPVMQAAPLIHAVQGSVASACVALVDTIAVASSAIQPLVEKTATTISDAACEALVWTITQSLPNNGYYSDVLAAKRAALDEAAASSVPGEACRALSTLAGDVLDQYLIHADVIESGELRISTLEGLLYEDATGVHHTFLGDVVCAAFSERKGLVQETLEVNLLNSMTNVMTALKAKYQENPYFLADLAMEVMQETAKELEHIRQGEHEDQTPEDELLYKNLSKAFLDLCLPNGPVEIELPFDDSNVLSRLKPVLQKAVYSMLETQVLPKLAAQSFNAIASEKSREKILLVGFEKARMFFKTGKITTPGKIFSETGPSEPYVNQEAFNKSFGAVVCTFIHYVDPSNYKLIKRLHVDRMIEKQGTKLSNKLARLDPVAAINFGLEQALQEVLSKGHWVTTEDKSRIFVYEKPEFVTTIAQNKERQALKDEQEVNKKERLDEVVSHFADDLHGLVKVAAGEAKVSSQDRKKLRHKFRRALAAFIRGCKKSAARLVNRLIGKKMIKKKGALTKKRLEEFPLAHAARALKSFAARKVNP